MPLNSVNTNIGAMVALQSLNRTTSDLRTTQARVTTGQRVASAKDDGAIFAIAQSQRATSAALDAVKDSLNRGKSTLDVALSAGETVSDLLSQMKGKALAAADTTLDTASRTALATDYGTLRDQIAKVVSTADFNGANMIKSGGASVQALASADGLTKLTVAAQSLALGGANVTVTAASTFTDATTAAACLVLVSASITNVGAALAKLGTGSKALDTQLSFTSKLQDTLDAGVGNLVDADLAKESAKLQALQTKQQLGIQALSIANSSANSLLSLFR